MSSPLLEDFLTPQQILSVAKGVADAEYSLLLGAGASKGGSAGGRSLPAGAELAREIVSDFGIESGGEELGLQDAYEAASDLWNAAGLSVGDYLKMRFEDCVPAPWLHQLCGTSWRRIWTLNIDDSVEQAYSTEASPRQRLEPILWDEPHADPDSGEVQLVYLHGSARAPHRIVFSLVEYLRATTAPHAWHRIFGDHFQERPFLVVGATLRGEFDLAAVIRRGNQSLRMGGLPSVFVNRSITDVQRSFVTKWGLIPVEMTGEEFMDQLQPHIAAAENEVRSIVQVRDGPLPAEAQTFLADFVGLSREASAPRKFRDFYLGYDPTWFDISVEKDAVFGSVDTVMDSVRAALAAEQPVQRLELISGPWGTGKSTALLRVGRELVNEGIAVYQFRGEATVDPESTAWWLSRQRKAVLLFDGVADFATEIEVVLESCRQAAITAIIVGVERQQRLRTIRANINASFVRLDGERQMRVLSNQDIVRLLSKLRDQTRLGRITRWGRDAQFEYFEVDHRRQLFNAMADLEDGPGFLDRLNSEFSRDALTMVQKDILSLCAFTYEFGYPLPLGVLSHATGISSREVLEAAEDGALGEWVDVSPQGLRLRHRYIAQLVVEKVLTQSDRYRLSLQLARSLAPRVDRDAIARRTLAHRIVRNIVDADIVQRWVGEDVLRWYAEIFSEYGWNARYWEQRALAHLHCDDHATARSYAERAVGIYADPFTLTTLAHVMLRQLESKVLTNGELDERLYSEATQHLFQARERSLSRDDYPYRVFFDSSLRVFRELKRRGQTSPLVEREVREWLSDADSSGLTNYPEYRELLIRVKREFARQVAR